MPGDVVHRQTGSPYVKAEETDRRSIAAPLVMGMHPLHQVQDFVGVPGPEAKPGQERGRITLSLTVGYAATAVVYHHQDGGTANGICGGSEATILVLAENPKSR